MRGAFLMRLIDVFLFTLTYFLSRCFWKFLFSWSFDFPQSQCTLLFIHSDTFLRHFSSYLIFISLFVSFLLGFLVLCFTFFTVSLFYLFHSFLTLTFDVIPTSLSSLVFLFQNLSTFSLLQFSFSLCYLYSILRPVSLTKTIRLPLLPLLPSSQLQTTLFFSPFCHKINATRAQQARRRLM